MSIPNDIQALQELVVKLLTRVESLEAKNGLLLSRVKALEAENEHLLSKVKILEAENRELRARLDANSRNSHRPPSSEGLSKKPALPKKKKKRGGQSQRDGFPKGHSGKTLEMVIHPSDTIPCLPKHCSCGHSLEGVDGEIVERRQVFDLPEPKLEVIEYQRMCCTCPNCEQVVSGEFPEGVQGPVQYGTGVKALTTLLSVRGCLSYDKIKQLFSDLFGYAINEATLHSANKKAYEALQHSEQEAFRALLREQTVHFDETGLRVEGSNHWMHTATSESFTYLFVHKNRGKKALRSDYSLLPFFRGWAVHDCMKSYFNFSDCKHAVCGAHLMRELTALIEQDRKWAKAFRSYLILLYNFADQGRGILRKDLQIWADRRYEELLEMAEAEEPPPEKSHDKPGPAKATKGYNLYRRLKNYKSAVLAFAFHREVPFTNAKGMPFRHNQAERDLRPSKVKQKMAGYFRTLRGARVYARIQGFIPQGMPLAYLPFKNTNSTFSKNCAPR